MGGYGGNTNGWVNIQGAISAGTGGIELAIGAHAANNLVVMLLVRPLSLEADGHHPFNPLSLVSAAAIAPRFRHSADEAFTLDLASLYFHPLTVQTG